MKTVIVLLSILLFASVAWGDAFCAGWEAGYEAGYCYRQNDCFFTFIPMCPTPRYWEETYQDGYNRGFLAGKQARENR